MRPRIKILASVLGVSVAAMAAGAWALGYAPSTTRSAQSLFDPEPVGTILDPLATPAPANAAKQNALRGSIARTSAQLEDSIGPALLERADAPAIRQALEAYRKGDLAAGDSAAANALDDIARNALRWAAIRLAPAKAGYKRIADFIDSSPGWPSDGFLQARLEEALINERIPAAQVRARFTNNAPATATGRYALARALRDENPAESQALARKIWREDDF